MRTVFADTNYWVAIINPLDQTHKRAKEVEQQVGQVGILTTEAVFLEVLNYFCSWKPALRQSASTVVRTLMATPTVEVIPISHETFLAGIALYEAREDKGYSLTDCISMNVMRDRGINDVLTQDKHFAQEGFNILL
jgi:predicted nucleic acid-binding protein